MKKIAIITLFLLNLFACQAPHPCSVIAGSYIGKSIMGNSSGKASLQINTDCSAELEYVHGSLGQAVEMGVLHKTDEGYSFTSRSGGGTYDISIIGNKLVLEGYNWRCEMYKL